MLDIYDTKITECDAEIEKIGKIVQAWENKIQGILNTNPPPGPSGEYGSDMWKVLDQYSRAGALLNLSTRAYLNGRDHERLSECKEELKEIKEQISEKINNGTFKKEDRTKYDQLLDEVAAPLDRITGATNAEGKLKSVTETPGALNKAGRDWTKAKGFLQSAGAVLSGAKSIIGAAVADCTVSAYHNLKNIASNKLFGPSAASQPTASQNAAPSPPAGPPAAPSQSAGTGSRP